MNVSEVLEYLSGLNYMIEFEDYTPEELYKRMLKDIDDYETVNTFIDGAADFIEKLRDLDRYKLYIETLTEEK